MRAGWATVALCAVIGCTDAPQPATPPAASEAAVASAKGRVDIEGGVIRLAARRDGVIAQVQVEEGARVQAGQVLATLDDALAQRTLALARSETRQAEIELQKAELDQRSAQRELQRLAPLAPDDTVPRQELDRAHDALEAAGIAARAARAAVGTAQARAALAARELDERRIVAPLDGQIIQRQARPGNGVSTLNVTPLFLFVPDGPRIVRAELDEQYLSAVAAGQGAEIVLEADPQRTWRGRVLRIGKVVGQRTPSDDPAERQDNRVVEVVLALDAEDLLIGQRVIVRLLKS